MKNYTLILSLLFLSIKSSGQDVHFSNFNFSPLGLNPAQAGAQSDFRAVANYRDQWSNVGGNGYKTINVATDLTAFKSHSRPAWLGAGLNITNDQAGVGLLNTLQTDLSLSGCVQNNKSVFSGGMQFSYFQKSLNLGNYSWDSQFDGFNYNPTLPNMEYYTNTSFNYFSMGAGVNWYYSKTEHYMTANDEFKANMGLGVFHINKPRQSFKDLTNEKLFPKIVLHGNYSIGIHNKDLCLIPSFLVSFQGPSREFVIGNLFKFIITDASHFTHIKKAFAISIGGAYRNNDALIAQTMIEYDRYALGISYDMTTSRFKTASRSYGGLEINFRFHTFRSKTSSQM
ncbi:MAG: PorP/SprF family type IX secretion system membrane protein [Bacteroidota bacterium]|jgi:type IX secretion system PorP/SprF family membrane protein